MKKAFLIITLAVICVSTIMAALWATYNVPNTENVSVNFRFYKMKDGKETFNWYSLLSPVQLETQKRHTDTIHFTKRVIYPVAPKFELIAPIDSSIEKAVATEITRAISDTLTKITYNLSWDYDGQMEAVRNAATPSTIHPASPVVSLRMVGTASPEAAKYGFNESIQPGNLEIENQVLASNRVSLTLAIIKSQLEAKGITPSVTGNAYELQLQPSNVDSVIQNPALLNGMRYVDADTTITLERVVVTPFTFPILLPLWIIALTLLITSLLRKRNQKPVTAVAESKVHLQPFESTEQPVKDSSWRWFVLLIYIMAIIGAVYSFFQHLWWLLIGLILIIIVTVMVTIDYVLFWYEQSTRWIKKQWPGKDKPATCHFVARWFIGTLILILAAILLWATGHMQVSFR